MRIALVSSLVLTAACASAPKAGPVHDPVAEVERMFPSAESLDSSAVEVTIIVTNPTDTALTVSGIEYTMDTKDVAAVLKGTAESSASVAAGQKVELRFKQSIPFPTEVEKYKEILQRQTIPVELAGKVKLSNGKALDFERNGEVATPSLPKFVVNDAQAARYADEGVDVTIFFRLVNDNPFGVLVQSCEYTVFVNDVEARSETAAVGTRLLPSAGEEYEFSRQIGGKDEKFGTAMSKKILAEGKMTYRVEGKIDLAKVSIPFSHEGVIEIATGE